MARVDNLENFLTDVAGAIKTKKGTTNKIPAANFDTEIASIETGIDTSDATALASDLLKGKTAYNAEGKIEGTLELKDGDVKLFATKEEMRADTTAKEGDLALVYRNEQQNMTADMEVTTITFPENVTLPTAFTGRAYGRLRSVDSSVMFDGNCDLRKTSFRFDSFSNTGMIRASYTSTDGITYTRTSLQGDSGDLDNPVKLPTAVKGDANNWNDNFGYFMQIGTSVFEGIYIYKNNSWKLAPTQLTATSGYVYEQLLFYGKNGLESGTLGIPNNSFADANAEIYNKIQNQYENMEPRILTDDNKTINKNIYFIPVKKDGTPLLDTSKVTSMSYMFQDCSNLTTIPLLNTSKVTDMSAMFYGCSNLTTIPLLDTSQVTDMHYMFNRCSKPITIPLLNTSKVTNMADMFQDCSNLTTIPLLNTSKVTNMAEMFQGCSNLTTIPLLDTSKVTNMHYMFNRCSNLTTIPLLDTSQVTDMHYMFNRCSNLTTIPLLDTSQVTDMSAMFDGCEKLTTIPSLNTGKVTSIRYMFNSCTNLTTIPLLNTSKATNMDFMLQGCPNLSDDSLNIIMQMCINATSYTGTKALETIGLTSEQANKCKTLSNYSAFTSAGWTTGY